MRQTIKVHITPIKRITCIADSRDGSARPCKGLERGERNGENCPRLLSIFDKSHFFYKF